MKLGFDLTWFERGIQLPVHAPIGHLICVGGSGSGKSTALLYWILQVRKTDKTDLWILDFKASHEFDGVTKLDQYATFEDCYERLEQFYRLFQSLPEGGDGSNHILIIDEVAGLLTHFSMRKETKEKSEQIRQTMSSILMLGRSRRCYLWLVMQRFTATIFPSGCGAVDNFHIYVGLGRLTVEGRKALFAGEHLDGEEMLIMGQGKGLVLIEGKKLRAIILPQISKPTILQLLQPLA